MKTFTLTLSLVLAAAGLAAIPAQAATRYVEFSVKTFAERCDRHAGAFRTDGNIALCETQTVPVACAFVAVQQAHCQWPGIDNQRAVNRVIGMPSATAISSSSGGGFVSGGNGGGGIKGPGDLVNPDNGGPDWKGPQDFQAKF